MTNNKIKNIIKEEIIKILSDNIHFDKIEGKSRLDIDRYILNKDKFVNEGIFKSYDISFVANYICKTLHLTYNIEDFKTHKYSGFVMIDKNESGIEDSIILYLSKNFKQYDDLNRIINLCGFVESHIEHLDNEITKIDLEQNFQKEVRNLVSKYKYIYHLTPSIYVDKIMKNGLVPKSSNNYLKYNPRIYFLLDKKTINYQYVADMLYDQMINNTNVTKQEKENINKYKNYYTLLRVNTKYLIGKYKFYIDNNFQNSIYVTDNIPPQYIEIDTKNIKIQ